jgi:hypothetical protein
MRPLTASTLLTLWEHGLTQPPLQRALALLIAAYPDTPPETLAALPLGQRDARLLTLRAATFGERLNSLVPCPQCGERLELAFNIHDIRAGTALEDGIAPDHPLSLTVDDYALTFRLPNSLDLAALATTMNPTARHLLDRCLLTATHAGTPTRDLPPPVVQALTAAMSAADPQADVQLALTCPACHHPWQATFDILAYFWSEIHTWAQRTLREIHLLASAYGWREPDILALTPLRRAMYLQMLL